MTIELFVAIEQADNQLEFIRIQCDNSVSPQLQSMFHNTTKRMDGKAEVPFALDRMFDKSVVCVINKNSSTNTGFFETIQKLVSPETNWPLQPFFSTDDVRSKKISIYGALEYDPSTLTISRVGVKASNMYRRSLKKAIILRSTVEVLKDPVYTLDYEFDFIYESEKIRSLGATALYKILGINKVAKEQLHNNISKIEESLTFLSLNSLKDYEVVKHNGARLAMKLVTEGDYQSWEPGKFKKLLDIHDIEYTECSEGDEVKVIPAEGHELDILKVLAKNVYHIEVGDNELELREASHSTAR